MARIFNGAARVRPDEPDTVAIRWTVEDRPGLPVDGFTILRDIGGNQVQIVVDLTLPGATPAGAAGRTIDIGQLQQDWNARGTGFGAPRPDFDDVLALVPLLQFALPDPDEAGLQASLGDIASLFFNEHERAPAMVARHWSRRAIVDIAAIAAMRGSAVGADARLYADVVRFYRKLALPRLLFHATNFEIAKFLGLGFDDQPGVGGDTLPEYLVTATYYGTVETRRFKVRAADPHWPPAPDSLTATSGRTAIGYPALAPFFNAGAWRSTSPAGASPSLAGLAVLASQGPRDFPSACTHLTWTVASLPQDDREEQKPLSPPALFWTIERSDFGAPSAVLDQVPLGGGSPFRTCHNGERIPSKEKSFNDDEAMPWGEPPMEGWYRYRVRGIDMFGIAGDYSPTADVRLRDIFAPISPVPMVMEERLELPPTATLPVTVGLDWAANNELTGPDAEVFHLVQHWTPETCAPVRIKSCHDILEADGTVGPINLLETDVVLSDPGGQALADNVIAGFSGMTLHAVEGHFRIRERGTRPSSIRVERSGGAAPPLGTAGIVGTGPTASTAVQEVPRNKPIVGMLVVDGLKPVAVRVVDPVSKADLGSMPGHLYSHLLRHRFRVEPSADGTQLLIIDPAADGDATGAALLRDLVALSEADAIAFLSGSPALVLPRNDVAVTFAPPQTDFIEGSVRFSASASDRVPYQRGPYGPGNESDPIDLVRIARVLRPPVRPTYLPRRLWARDAASFDHGARVTISWPAFAFAKTYQVERAFETALGLAPSANEAALLAYADGASADAAFERVTERAFLPEWSDTLPGQAPTRVVYRVRAVTAAGVVSDWLIVALVRVPDIRVPRPPNFLTARPTPGADRALECTWVQAGPPDGIGFILEHRVAHAFADTELGWSPLAEILPVEVVHDAGDRVKLVVAAARPGCLLDVRIRAVRHALDPDDPRAIALRRIVGPASQILRAAPIGRIAPPSDLAATLTVDHIVTLTWTNSDPYAQLEVQWRSPGRWGFERERIAGDASEWSHQPTLAGDWLFRIVAVGWGEQAMSEQLTFTVTGL